MSLVREYSEIPGIVLSERWDTMCALHLAIRVDCVAASHKDCMWRRASAAMCKPTELAVLSPSLRLQRKPACLHECLDLLHVLLREMLTQVLELTNKADKLVDFAWEPKGSRFAMLHGDGPRPSFSLYAMKDSKTTTKGVQLIGTQIGKQANSIHWSPQVPLYSLY